MTPQDYGGRQPLDGQSTLPASMNVKCPNCGRTNSIPAPQAGLQYHCGVCGTPLPLTPQQNPDAAAVGLVGGAALGALWGPAGALIGAVIGYVIGDSAKSGR